MPDRQRVQRKALQLNVTLLQPGDDKVRTSGTLTDVSAGGAYVATYDLLPPGSPVVLEIDFPGNRVQIGARVVHDESQERSESATMFSAGMGLRFEDPYSLEVAELVRQGHFLVDNGGRRKSPR